MKYSLPCFFYRCCRHHRRVVLALFMGVGATNSYALDAHTPAILPVALAEKPLPEAIMAKLSAANIPADSLSMVVQPLDAAPAAQSANAPSANDTLISYHPNTPRTPASTQKLIPTYIALDTLGKDFVWQTKLYQHGVVWRGTLYGDIIVAGSGAPKLENTQLSALLSMIKSQGIERVDGNLIIDNRQFRDVKFDVNAFDGKGLRPYNAQPNALLTDFGTLKVTLEPIVTTAATTAKSTNTASQPTASQTQDYQVSVSPLLADFSYPSTLSSSQQPCNTSQDDWIANLSPTQLSFNTLPSIHCGKQERYLTFPDGDALIKKQISADWQKILPNFQGDIRFADDERLLSLQKPLSTALPWYVRGYLNWVKAPQTPRLIGYMASNPLSEQIKDINHHSNNVMTEQIALSLPLYASPKLAGQQQVSDYPKTFALMQRWWQQHLPNDTAPVMSRASGLCRDCQITPSSMLALLTLAYQSPNFAVFRESMGVAGESGTIKALKWRQPNNPAIGHAWIKTGTLDNVTAMAGYVQGQSGKWYAVVGLINADNAKNNDKAKAVLDEMLAWTATK